MFYSYDWIDTARWDRWLYENYGQWQQAMDQALDDRLGVLARWSDRHSVPLVIGEGWIGYTAARRVRGRAGRAGDRRGGPAPVHGRRRVGSGPRIELRASPPGMAERGLAAALEQ